MTKTKPADKELTTKNMTAKNKKKLQALIITMDGYKGDYGDGLETLGFQELVDILDYKFRHELGLTVKLEQIPTLTKTNRN